MRIKAGFMRWLTGISMLIAFVSTLMGCALMEWGQDNPATAELSVKYAVAKVIDGDPERAERVHEIAQTAKGWVDQDTDATLDLLADRVHEQVPWAELAPEDRMLIEVLLSRLHAELQERIGEGVLAEDDRVVIRTVLDWIIDASVP